MRCVLVCREGPIYSKRNPPNVPHTSVWMKFSGSHIIGYVPTFQPGTEISHLPPLGGSEPLGLSGLVTPLPVPPAAGKAKRVRNSRRGSVESITVERAETLTVNHEHIPALDHKNPRGCCNGGNHVQTHKTMCACKFLIQDANVRVGDFRSGKGYMKQGWVNIEGCKPSI